MNKSFFHIEMLPSNEGDALWIEYGNEQDKRRILIDGGPIEAFPALEKKLTSKETLPPGDKRIELLIITHVDTDHIDGILRLLTIERNNWLFEPRDIWFNGWRHMQKARLLGPDQGDIVGALINMRAPDKWNRYFHQQCGDDVVAVKPDFPLPVITLDDGFSNGMKITLLSPNTQKLKKMAKKWETDMAKKHLEPGNLKKALERYYEDPKYREYNHGLLGGEDDLVKVVANQLSIDASPELTVDNSPANGSSIAFLAEFDNKSCLFLGDAHASVVYESIKRLTNGKQLTVDAVKMPHHGSRGNVSKKLLSLIDAKHFLVSTNGNVHGHPNREAIESVIITSQREPVFWFNYISEQNQFWKTKPDIAGKKYDVQYPELGCEGKILKLEEVGVGIE